MNTACFRSVSLMLGVLTLAGCQSPGSFGSLFGKKDDPVEAERLAGKAPQAGRDSPGFNGRPGGLFGNRGADEDLRLARKAADEGNLIAARMSYEKVLMVQPKNIE